MRRRPRIRMNIIMGIIVCILAVYAGMHLRVPWAGKPGKDELKNEFNEILLGGIERSYLTGLSYYQGDPGTGIEEWVASTAMQFVPLGTYVEEKSFTQTDTQDQETYEMILAKQANDENAVDENGKLVGEPPAEETAIQTSGTRIDTSIEKLSNFDYLLNNFYAVDASTMIGPEQLNAGELLGKDMKMSPEKNGPKVLIYHTHSQETFADSTPGDVNTSIVGMGSYLTQLLTEKYGIETMHHQGVYDLINGQLDRSMAYEFAEPEIERILNENPSIEVVIDLHRDGVPDTTHLVTEVNGKQTAQIMFFNGLSKTRANGDITYLPNPYIQDNLAFSLQLQIAASNKYPGFTRRIFLRGYRYNMHFKPKTLLIEAGAQTNTVDEMRNAMVLLADTLNSVLVK